MRVIRKGIPPEEMEHSIKCRKCTTVFAFLRREARRVEDQRDGDYLEIACPVCGEKATQAVL